MLVGPWMGALCVSVVLFVQGLVFADGGLSALGLNIINMALVTALGGYLVFLALRWLLPRTASGVVVAAGIAGFVSVVLASLAFTLEYAFGGTGGASVATVFGAMVGVHVLIGIGEGVITAATVAVVLSVRPDVVYGAADLEHVLQHPRRPRHDAGRPAMIRRRRAEAVRDAAVRRLRGSAGVAARCLRQPLREHRTRRSQQGRDRQGVRPPGPHRAVADSPLAGYAVKDVKSERVSRGLSGILGVLITLLVATALFGGLWFVARRRRVHSQPSSAGPLAPSS